MNFTSGYESPWASPAQLHSVDTGSWRYRRPVVKADKCSQCGSCYLFCPVGCVQDRGHYFAADLTYCKGCGICALLCPVSAITMVGES